MTNIYIIRHGEAEGNIYRRLHGQYNSKLTPNGLRQVKALEARFADVAVDAVYSSDLCRTCQTARAIYVPKGLPLHRDPRFREVQVGQWENRTFGELERTEPEALANFIRNPEDWIAPGAETYEEYAGRFAEGLREAAEANPGKTIAVFSHGCVISGGFHLLLGRPHNASACDNTGVSLLRYENGVFTPDYIYDNSHLSPAISTRARQRWWREQGGAFNLWFRDAEPRDRSLYDGDHWPPKEDRCRIALLGDEPVGYVCFGKNSLSRIWLRPEYRHRRMGDQLLGEALLTLRAGGVKALSLGVPTFNLEALSFFDRHGAVPVQMDDVYTAYQLDIGLPAQA